MKYLLLSFLISAVLNIFIIRASIRAAYDSEEGVQKFHKRPVPRIGGVAIYAAQFVVALAFFLAKKPFAKEFLLFLLCGLPVFLSGLMEDLTKRVSPSVRLLASLLSAALFVFVFGKTLKRIEFPLLDSLISLKPVSILLTVIFLSGVTHAFNIIDGFNGLSSGVAMLVMGALAYVSFLMNDQFLVYLSLIPLFSVLGFFIWNYPFGFIFLGDGGAYLLGFLCAASGILLVDTYKEVSVWFLLLLLIYPVWETLFSIYRKRFLRGMSPAVPDGIHFHMLIYKRLVKLTFGNELEVLERNAFTSPYLWIIQLLCVIPAVTFWNNPGVLAASTLLFVLLYTWLYFRMVRFKIPKPLLFK